MPDFVTVGNLFHGIVENPDWGKTLAEAGLGSYTASFQKLAHLSQRPNPETEFLIPYESQYGTVNFKGFFDGFDPAVHAIDEIKTSPYKLWDQRKLEGHGQVKLYSLVYHSIYEVMPEIRLRSLVIVEDPNKCKAKELTHTFKLTEAITVQQEINNAISIIHQLNERHRKTTSA